MRPLPHHNLYGKVLALFSHLARRTQNYHIYNVDNLNFNSKIVDNKFLCIHQFFFTILSCSIYIL